MAISSLGVGSGLDLEGLITKLMAVESKPLTALQTKQNTYNSQISALGKIKSAIASLQTAASAMKDPRKLTALTATTSDTSVATASVATGAVGGSYNVDVTQLASAQKLVSGAAANVSAGGTLTIEKLGASGGSVDVTIDAGASLSDVAVAINSSNAGVTATVVNGSGGQQLVVTGNETGKDNEFKMSGSSGITGLDFDPASATGDMTRQTKAQDATVEIDGIKVSSATNSFENAITGVTLNAVKTGSTRLDVSADSSVLREKAEAFVKEYNNVVSTLKTLSQYVPGGTSGVLNGDSTVRSVMSQVRNAASTMPSGVDPSLKYLFDLGISSSTDGTLTLNADKLNAAIEKNSAAVTASLTAYGSAFDKLATQLNSDQGAVTSRTQGLEQSTKLLDTQMETLTARLEKIDAQYRKQFSALDTLVSKMQSTSNYLAQQLTMLGNMASSR
ncbi:MAG: flagellar filament capping protein FliD [Candidatus Accumulibacter sp.]|jgi:flagellar hook-associated protein 2|nr:flagellar filament capping protein FliD [Accumulibacter sp.]